MEIYKVGITLQHAKIKKTVSGKLNRYFKVRI
jgi:hypothetical protein